MSRVITSEEHEFLGQVFSWASKWSAEGVSTARFKAIEYLMTSVELSLQHMTTPIEKRDTIRDYQRMTENLDSNWPIECSGYFEE